ncbi:MAG: undecaprenyl/decaprenyl-phosphate alpha-N-acetylglucosaminyl 1-phosphate transferase, partial [Actinomycetota bacterium]|nr:undecaprenyl/decaprenyl-phosphate alpha-N-acetylglucosaminyl 1-phosphate transferase [Actinomycetota bacterium]
MEARLLGAFTLPLLAVLVATPVAIRVAEWLNFHDRPVGYKGHARPTPYLGGTALIAGFLLGAVVLGGGFSRLAPIAGGALFLWMVGTLDDRRTVTPQLRVVAAIGAATLLFAGGLGWSIFDQPSADYVLTVLWVVGLVNAFNLMDNMDGASSTIASLSALGAAVLAISLGDPVLGALALGLVGACLGFLPYNLARPSARIFLGDGGSMPIGFVVAATIMALPFGGEAGWHRLLAAVLLAGLPILDTTLVMVSRHRARISLLQGGTDHITHRLRRRLPSARAVALVLAGAQALLCLIAFSVTQLGDLSVAAVWATLVVGAAAVVATMERDAWRPQRSSVPAAVAAEATPGPEAPGTGFEPAPLPVAGPPPSDPQRMGRLEVALLVFVGLGLGLSTMTYGFYDLAIWGPIALMLLAVLLGLVIARPATLRVSAVIAVVGLVALWGWALLSTAWAESGERALTEANRWMLYAALLGVLLSLLRTDRLGKVLLGTTTAAVLGVGVWMLAAMALGDGAELFIGGRLDGLLGYINGQAAYLLLGFWPLVALAEYARRPPVRGLAASGATLLAALVLLSQSRAVVPALLISAVVLLIAIPGRQRRAWALLIIAAGIAVLAKPLLAVYASADGGAPTSEAIRGAALATVLVAAAVGVAWAGLPSLATQLVAGSARRRRRALGMGWALLATVLVVGMVGVVSVVGNPGAGVRAQFDAFTQLEDAGEGDTRFSQGAGNRYDYWRIAVGQFLDEPVRGLGAGGYTQTYFQERQTTEDIRQPHSLQLQTLSELGIVGGAALLLFLGGVAAGFLRRALAARHDRSEALLGVAAGGLFCTWLVHTSVDWLHLIPGVTGIALCAAAVLVGPWPRVRASLSPTRWHRALLAGLAVLVFLAAVHLGRATLADRELRSGQAALEAGQPQRALAQARDSLELNPEV